MAIWNDYSYVQYTVNGQTRVAGSLTSPTQTTYTGKVLELLGDVADSTSTLIFAISSPGTSEVATWTTAKFWCDQDCRVLLAGAIADNAACWVIPANTWTPLSKYQIPTYANSAATYIAGALVEVNVIYLYQDSGETANWRLILTD